MSEFLRRNVKPLLDSLFTSFFTWAGPAVAGATAGVYSSSGSSDYISSIIFAVVLSIILLSIVVLAKTMLRFPRIRRLFGREHRFVGVWVETYQIEEDNVLTHYRSVMVIHQDVKDNKLKLYGRTFWSDDANECTRYDGSVMEENTTDNRIEYRYTGEYANGAPVRGYGFYKFYENTNKPGIFDSAVGKWVELESEKKALIPQGETRIRLIDWREVRKLIGKKDYPDQANIKEFFALSRYTWK